MQTMNEFVDSIYVPKTLLYTFDLLKEKLLARLESDPYRVLYMCHRAGSQEFDEWMREVINDHTPSEYSDFVEQRGIVALFVHKQWMMLSEMYIYGEFDPTPTQEEYKISNELRLQFINLLIDKIKSKKTV